VSRRPDLLVTGRLVVTMDDERSVWRDAAVAVTGDRITAVGPRDELLAEGAARVVDGGDAVVLPGLIDAHVHLTGPALFPGAEPAQAPLSEHFPDWVLPPHVASDGADEAAAARFSALSMLSAGTTGCIEAGVIGAVDGVLQALAPTGLRAAVGAWVSDGWPGPLGQPDAAAAIEALGAAGRRQGLVVVWPSVVGHDGVSDEVLVAAARLAQERGTGWTLHLSTGPEDGAHFRARSGRAPLAHLDALGVLSARTVIAHGLHLDDDEVAVLRRTGATVVHCPGAALRLCLGLAEHGRHPELPHVALGTDTVNASNHLDILRAAATACDAYGAARTDRSTLPAETALAWATRGGARAMGLEGQTGQLLPGTLADLVVADCGPVIPHVANALVHGAPRVRHVVVGGRQVVDDGRVAGEHAAAAAFQAAAARVRERLGAPAETGWPSQHATLTRADS